MQEQNNGKEITERMIDKEIHKRANLLMKYVNVVIDKFSETILQIPAELGDFVKILKFNLDNSPEYFYQLVGGWFFLRAIIPALVSPGGNTKKSSAKNITPRNRRNLILIGKVLQSISNEATFGDKESYLKILQPCASKSYITLRNTIDEIVKGPITSISRELKQSSRRIEKVRPQTTKLFKLLADEINDIKESILNSDGSSIIFSNPIYVNFDEDEKLFELQELESIVTASNNVKDKLNESNCNVKWNVVARRRNCYKRIMESIQTINDTFLPLSCNFTPSPVRAASSDVLLSLTLTPRNGGSRWKNSSEPSHLSPRNSFSNSDVSSETTSLISDDITEDILSVMDPTEEEETEMSEIFDKKIILKIKYNSKVVNLSVQQDCTLVDVTNQIRAKFTLRKIFGIYTINGAEIGNEKQWIHFLENEGIATESVLLYRLFVKNL